MTGQPVQDVALGAMGRVVRMVVQSVQAVIRVVRARGDGVLLDFAGSIELRGSLRSMETDGALWTVLGDLF